jgi:hypothetical protein
VTPKGRRCAYAVASLLVLHVVLVWATASTKSPTFDDGVYVASGLASYVHGDDRVVETPAPWALWHTLPHLNTPPALPLDHPRWESILTEVGHGNSAQMDWSSDALWRTPGVNGREVIAVSRRWMILYPLLLLALLALWTRRIGGPLAATVAVAAYALDPNLIGHGGVVKEDVLMSLLLLAASWATWRIGLRATHANVVTLGVLVGLGLCTKHSAVVTLPLAALLLLLRAVLPAPWTPEAWAVPWAGTLRHKGKKVIAAAAITLAVALTAWGTLWVGYGLRYSPTPDPALELQSRGSGLQAHEGTASVSVVVTAILWAEEAHLVPQHWGWGIREMTRIRSRWGYLRGEISRHGWWYYFLLAFLVKVPLATLLAIGLASTQTRAFVRPSPRHGWALLCLAVPLVTYGAAALVSGMNIGFRHVLPPYVLSFPLLGLAAQASWKRWGRKAGGVLAALGLGLLVECLVAFPNYIAFFNPIAGGTRGGLEWLGDSNLDWGQDLPALASWRVKNPEGTLYLCYFGTADPAAFGLDYTNLPGGYRWGPPPELPEAPGVIAISATHLQGIYFSEKVRRFYAPLKEKTPRAVLGGGTIYLFDWP